MQSEKLSPNCIQGLREKSVQCFEDIYLMTYKNTLADIKTYVQDEEQAWEILKETYARMWSRSGSSPEQSLFRAWLRILTKESIKKFQDIEDIRFDKEIFVEDTPKLEQKAQGVLLQLEESLAMMDKKEEDGPFARWTKKMFKIVAASVFAVLALVIVTQVLFGVYDILREWGMEKRLKQTEMESLVPAEKTDKEFSVGWINSREGKQYRKSNGRLAQSEFVEILEGLYYFDENTYLKTGILKKGAFVYDFDSVGKLLDISVSEELYSGDTMFLRDLRQNGYADRVEHIILDSPTEDESWIYFLEKSADKDLHLLRFHKEDAYLEEIDSAVKGFALTEDGIWYGKDALLKRFDKDGEGERIYPMYRLASREESYSFLDSYGNPISRSGDWSLQLGNREYQLQGSSILAVSGDKAYIGGREYVLNREDGVIYSGETPVYMAGKGITAMAAMGEYIYCCVYMGEKEGMSVSALYKYHTGSGERESVGDSFSGEIRNMYAYPDFSGIYMEYLPDFPLRAYGKVAILSPQEEILSVEDAEFRKEGFTGENDMLHIVLVDEEGIHCYWRNCIVEENRQIRQVDTKLLLINESELEELQ